MEYLPLSTTSLIQPMAQGVIQAFKNHNRQLMLNQVVVVELAEGEADTRGQRTLVNLKDYN